MRKTPKRQIRLSEAEIKAISNAIDAYDSQIEGGANEDYCQWAENQQVILNNLIKRSRRLNVSRVKRLK